MYITPKKPRKIYINCLKFGFSFKNKFDTTATIIGIVATKMPASNDLTYCMPTISNEKPKIGCIKIKYNMFLLNIFLIRTFIIFNKYKIKTPKKAKENLKANILIGCA